MQPTKQLIELSHPPAQTGVGVAEGVVVVVEDVLDDVDEVEEMVQPDGAVIGFNVVMMIRGVTVVTVGEMTEGAPVDNVAGLEKKSLAGRTAAVASPKRSADAEKLRMRMLSKTRSM